MERGLLWLPLLIAFFWLAWAGWNDYQKIEAYKGWARQFDQAKYDIYSVLGQKGKDITWGKPTRQGPTELQTFSLEEVDQIRVVVGDRPVDPDNPPTNQRNIALEFTRPNAEPIRIPFTELDLATKWANYLQTI